MENRGFPVAHVTGDYKTVSKNILPTLIVAVSTGTGVITNSGSFVFDNGSHNLAYEFEYPY